MDLCLSRIHLYDYECFKCNSRTPLYSLIGSNGANLTLWWENLKEDYLKKFKEYEDQNIEAKNKIYLSMGHYCDYYSNAPQEPDYNKYYEENIKNDIKVYCLFCSPSIEKFDVSHRYSYNRCECQENHYDNDYKPNNQGRIDFVVNEYDDEYNPGKKRIQSYKCYLCGNYTKYYSLITQTGEIVTYESTIYRKCTYLICDECTPRGISTARRDEELYHLSYEYKPNKEIKTEDEKIIRITKVLNKKYIL